MKNENKGEEKEEKEEEEEEEEEGMMWKKEVMKEWYMEAEMDNRCQDKEETEKLGKGKKERS